MEKNGLSKEVLANLIEGEGKQLYKIKLAQTQLRREMSLAIALSLEGEPDKTTEVFGAALESYRSLPSQVELQYGSLDSRA